MAIIQDKTLQQPEFKKDVERIAEQFLGGQQISNVSEATPLNHLFKGLSDSPYFLSSPQGREILKETQNYIASALGIKTSDLELNFVDGKLIGFAKINQKDFGFQITRDGFLIPACNPQKLREYVEHAKKMDPKKHSAWKDSFYQVGDILPQAVRIDEAQKLADIYTRAFKEGIHPAFLTSDGKIVGVKAEDKERLEKFLQTGKIEKSFDIYLGEIKERELRFEKSSHFEITNDPSRGPVFTLHSKAGIIKLSRDDFTLTLTPTNQTESLTETSNPSN